MRKSIYRGAALLMCTAALTFGATACSSNKEAETTAAESTEAASEQASKPDSESTDVETADAPSADEGVAAKRGEEPITLEPIVNHLSVDGSMDATFSAKFTPAEDMTKDGDTYMLSFTGYYAEKYEEAFVPMLKAGDTIVIGGESILIDSIEDSNGIYMINGGLDEGGYDLIVDEDGTYRERGYDDIRTYGEIGKATLPIADDCVITDNADLDNPDRKLTLEELAADDTAYGFNERNTMLTVEDGKITEIARSYTP